MRKYLILVKHSLPRIEEHKPALEWHLSEEGKLLSERLAQRLSSYQPDIVLSSQESKARETAAIVARELHLKFYAVENLHEHDRSEVGFLSKDEFQHVVREFFLRPDELVFGKETANQAHARFSKAVDSILESNKNKTIVIVAHGTVISLFVSRQTGSSDYLLWNKLGLPSFVVLDMQSKSLVTMENIS